jgi:hypothetical protein
MTKTAWLRTTVLVLVAAPALGVLCLGQTGGGNEGQRPAQVDLFGGGDYPGGYLKYTYTVAREGTSRSSTTSTEIAPQADGTYAVVSTSTETLPLDMVRIGFFGIPLLQLGIHVAENSSGTIDLSPLSNISSTALEPGKDYLLPDGGDFQAGSAGTIAGVDVVYGTYTNANYTNVEIQLAFAVDLTIRSLLPFPAMMEFRYSSATDAPLTTFSLVKLTEFVRRP